MSCVSCCKPCCAWPWAFWILFARSARNAALALCALIPLASGCAGSAALTGVPAPATPGAVVTDSWCYESGESLVTVPGTWVHLPADEAGALLLWIEAMEGRWA
ncbi:hypothetical protein [uncultured Desulfovibrio sp.]|uniref:hypothetical protein n=1 Tax=uncultured Desulfovibrio sp. TaxID=167968 RepID=UPI0026204C7A|nr:hypothetical protein [uncultured Desulfovibrio sp.]